MTISCGLTGSAGSSISIVDPAAGRYTKVAERGTACRLGQSFPLDEGVTGRVMASRRPVVLATYSDVATGHLPPGSRAREGAVAAIPIWWRGDVIGANVVFAGCTRDFTTQEVDQLEVVTQVVAPGIVTAAARDLAMTHLLSRAPDRDPGSRLPTESRRASAAEVALGLVSLAARAGMSGEDLAAPVHVRVVQDDAGPRLQIRDGGEHDAGWREMADAAEGSVRLDAVEDAHDRPSPAAKGSPFSAREQQVAGLLRQGLSDRAIAQALLISPKTAEKHVGAVLRKTGTTSRTAAVVRALERGWLAKGAAEPG